MNKVDNSIAVVSKTLLRTRWNLFFLVADLHETAVGPLIASTDNIYIYIYTHIYIYTSAFPMYSLHVPYGLSHVPVSKNLVGNAANPVQV